MRCQSGPGNVLYESGLARTATPPRTSAM
jgi:hypothetical protein